MIFISHPIESGVIHEISGSIDSIIYAVQGINCVMLDKSNVNNTLRYPHMDLKIYSVRGSTLFLNNSYLNSMQPLRGGSTVEPQLSGPRLSGRFLWSQFCHEYLLVMIKIRSHILHDSTVLKSEVKASLFCFQNAKDLSKR